MRLDSIALTGCRSPIGTGLGHSNPMYLPICAPPRRRSTRSGRRQTKSTPDNHSEVAPPLPIPNRAVKRFSADDSADYLCESRTLSGTPHNAYARPFEVGRLHFWSASGRGNRASALKHVFLFTCDFAKLSKLCRHKGKGSGLRPIFCLCTWVVTSTDG